MNDYNYHSSKCKCGFIWTKTTAGRLRLRNQKPVTDLHSEHNIHIYLELKLTTIFSTYIQLLLGS